MNPRLPSTASLLAFEATARLGGFTEAAAELSLSQSTVSYRVRQLESQLGLILLRRLTRRIELSPAGERLLPRVQRILQDLDEAIGALQADGVAVLRVRLSTYFAMRWLSPRLLGWTEQGGATVVFLHDDGEPADVEIRWAPQPPEPAWLLLPTTMRAYVAPRLLADPHEASGILKLTLLSEPDGLDLWPTWCQVAGLPWPTEIRRIVLADSNVRVQAAVDGLGAVLADDLVAPEVAEGKLVAALDIAVTGSGYGVSVHATGSMEARRFLDWMCTAR